MSNQAPPVKDARLVLRIDAAFIERMNAIAAERYEGNRSYLVREAIRQLIERYETQTEKAA